MTCFLPNLTFEDELQGRSAGLSKRTQQAHADLAPLMGLLACPGDTVLVSGPVTGLPACLADIQFDVQCPCPAADHNECLAATDQPPIVPWGWTTATVNLAQQSGMTASELPSLAAVRRVNSRAFAADFDMVLTEQDGSLTAVEQPFGRMCYDFVEWQQTVAEMHSRGYERWIAKPQHSHAGRNRLIANGENINREQTAWLQKHLSNSESDPQSADESVCGVYVEPWVNRTDEVGLQFHIHRQHDGSVSVALEGTTRLINDPMGRYLGSAIRSDAVWNDKWAAGIDHGRKVCEAMADAGYFGPVGIDCFRFTGEDGQTAIRLCNDINARYTMGRLAGQLSRWVRPGETGLWSLIATADFPRFVTTVHKIFAEGHFDDVELMITSPESVDGRSVCAGSLLLVAKCEGRLTKVAETLRTFAKR